jgi:hypothetical protein
MAHRRRLQRFYKMTGSGNDFVVFNAADGPLSEIENPDTTPVRAGHGRWRGWRGLPGDGGRRRCPNALL